MNSVSAFSANFHLLISFSCWAYFFRHAQYVTQKCLPTSQSTNNRAPDKWPAYVSVFPLMWRSFIEIHFYLFFPFLSEVSKPWVLVKLLQRESQSFIKECEWTCINYHGCTEEVVGLRYVFIMFNTVCYDFT